MNYDELRGLLLNLEAEALSQIDKIRENGRSTIIIHHKCSAVYREVLREVKNLLKGFIFINQDKEIEIYKQIIPRLIGEFIFNRSVYELEIELSILPVEKKNKYYDKQLREIRKFYKRNKVIYRYYSSSGDSLDGMYFVKESEAPIYGVNSNKDFMYDANISRPLTYTYAKIRAYKQFETYIQNRIVTMNSKRQTGGIHNKKKAHWDGTKSELVELIYALHGSKCLSDGKDHMNVKQIAKVIESILDIDLGNIYRIFVNLKAKKRNRSQFLDRLKSSLADELSKEEEISRFMRGRK